ncbi:MAG: hypothetical protein KGJ78_08275 [Alphaproteobacteria bacterium]|nr:hypothetical protein [Alphaproteobacteria bacterium]
MGRASDDDETIRKRSAWIIPLGVFIVTFLLSAMFLLLYLAPSAPSLFEEQIAPTSRTDLITLSVNRHKFRIPANYLEYESERQGGERQAIELFALWPDMAGWSNWEAQTFASNAASSPIIYILIRDEKLNLTEADRLHRVYLGYVADTRGIPGPYGLRQYAFREDSGYHEEDLFVGDTPKGPVVMLCARLGGNVTSPGCLRDLLIRPGVSLSYRFKRSHLEDWSDIANGVDGLLASFESRRK